MGKFTRENHDLKLFRGELWRVFCDSHFESLTYHFSLQIPDKFWCPDRIVVGDNQLKYFQLPTVEEVSMKMKKEKDKIEEHAIIRITSYRMVSIHYD